MDINLKFDGFEGEILMRVATNIERLELMEEIGLDIFQMGKGDDVAKNIQNQKTIIALLKISKSHYKKVNLKKDGKTYKSFDDLDNDTGCQHIMMECAMKGLMGLGDEQKKVIELVNKAVRGLHWNDQQSHEMTPYVVEYIERKRLRKLGFTSSFDQLPYIKSMIFVAIDSKLDQISEEERKKALKKRGK